MSDQCYWTAFVTKKFQCYWSAFVTRKKRRYEQVFGEWVSVVTMLLFNETDSGWSNERGWCDPGETNEGRPWAFGGRTLENNPVLGDLFWSRGLRVESMLLNLWMYNLLVTINCFTLVIHEVSANLKTYSYLTCSSITFKYNIGNYINFCSLSPIVFQTEKKIRKWEIGEGLNCLQKSCGCKNSVKF